MSYYWLAHKPVAQRRAPQASAALVEVARVTPTRERVVVHAMGTVVPAQSIELAARVRGEIVDVSPRFVPGGQFRQGKRILQIDSMDYELAVRQRRGDLAKAECDLKQEMGQQSVAQREYELLGQEVAEEDMELLLRQPQLAMYRSAVAAAEATLKQAELDLERTGIVAPFNAAIQSRKVELGSQVAVGGALASLVNTDEYWIQVSVPLDELRWLDVPGTNSSRGSTVRVLHESAWGKEAFREGTIEGLMTDLEPEGRMARLLVSVTDPLDLKKAPEGRRPLILGAYVRVQIDGRDLPNVVRVDRTSLRDGRSVWVMRPDNTLDIRAVGVVWGGNEHVCIGEGLAGGDLLVTSDLATPVQGMSLRTLDSSADESSTPPTDAGMPERGSEGAP